MPRLVCPLSEAVEIVHSQVLPQPPKERVPHLSLGRLGAVLDLGVQLRLDPDSLVCDAPGVRLGFADQRRQALAQLGG
jgi:hypothetical protein